MRGASPDDGHLTERRTSEREQDSADLSAIACKLLHTECPHPVRRNRYPEVHLYIYVCPETRITLGKFRSVGLAEARHLAMKNRESLDKGY